MNLATLDVPPSWAPSWCYVYFLGAVIGALMVLFVALTSFKKLGIANVLLILIGLGFNFLHGMTYFWMCRSSLKQAVA